MTENIKIAQGDCLELMKDIPDGSIDMVLADPPYGITSRNKWDKVIPFEPMWEQLHRITRKNTPILMFAQFPFGSDLIQSNRKEYRYEWIWHKTMPVGFLNSNRMPLRSHENILVFYRKLPLYHPQMVRGGYTYKGVRVTQQIMDAIRRYHALRQMSIIRLILFVIQTVERNCTRHKNLLICWNT